MVKLRLYALIGGVGLYAILLTAYFLVWYFIIATGFNFSFDFSSVPQAVTYNTDSIAVNAGVTATMTIYRFGFIPVYTSTLGDISGYHVLFMVLSALPTMLFAISKAVPIAPMGMVSYSPNEFMSIMTSRKGFKFTLTNNTIANIETQDRLKGVTRIGLKQALLYIWAPVGFVWFILYQALGFLPQDASIATISVFSLVMWVAVIASAAAAILPRLGLHINIKREVRKDDK